MGCAGSTKAAAAGQIDVPQEDGQTLAEAQRAPGCKTLLAGAGSQELKVSVEEPRASPSTDLQVPKFDGVRKRPAAPAQFKVRFERGSIGARVNMTSGEVISVHMGGQAEKHGIQPGWALKKINDNDYSEELFVHAQNRNASWIATFSQALRRSSEGSTETWEEWSSDAVRFLPATARVSALLQDYHAVPAEGLFTDGVQSAPWRTGKCLPAEGLFTSDSSPTKQAKQHALPTIVSDEQASISDIAYGPAKIVATHATAEPPSDKPAQLFDIKVRSACCPPGSEASGGIMDLLRCCPATDENQS